MNNKNTMTALEGMLKKMLGYKKVYGIVTVCTFIISYLMVCSVPRYYVSEVCLAPESSGLSSSGSLGSVASMVGLGSLGKFGSNIDAINTEIYPNLLGSNDFLIKLMTVEVENSTKDVKCDYYTYMRDKQETAWWSAAIKGIVGFFSKNKEKSGDEAKGLNIFKLTKDQKDIFDNIRDNISCSVDRKTDMVTIVVKDQDPVVCATIADQTCKKLQEFIVDYRTKKARIDYEYFKKLCGEAKQKYEKARQLYGSYSDANMDVLLESYKSKVEDMENDMQLKYNMYTSLNTQMQMAQAKLQESIPAFTTIQSASVPTKPTGPKRVSSAVLCVFLAFLITTFVILRHDIKAIFF